MKIVTIAGITYIGKLGEKDGIFTLNSPMRISTKLGKLEIAAYLKLKNDGDIKPLTFGGPDTNYLIEELNDDQEMDLSVCKIIMKRSKKKALTGLENRTFDSLMGIVAPAGVPSAYPKQ